MTPYAAMTNSQKLRFFRQLVKLGFKEIEVSYPAASETDFQFVQDLINNGEIPDDVWIQVLTPARSDLIKRTFEALKGSKNAIVHMYNATSCLFREVVFNADQAKTVSWVPGPGWGLVSSGLVADEDVGFDRLATQHTQLVRELAEQYAAEVRAPQYSPRLSLDTGTWFPAFAFLTARYQLPIRILSGDLFPDRTRIRCRGLWGCEKDLVGWDKERVWWWEERAEDHLRESKHYIWRRAVYPP
jgi:hypothetical protein